jgi:Bacteriophage holin of superfamily 6 (Holin_LLH)
MTFTEQLIILIIPLVLPPLVALSAVLYQHLLQRVPEKKRELIEKVIGTVVTAIEQTAPAIVGNQEKKQAAMNMASEMLAHLNIKASPATLSAMIESSVYALNQSKDISTNVAQPAPLTQTKAG